MGRANSSARRKGKAVKGKQHAIFRWPSAVEIATLAISVAALASSVWAVVESKRASREIRWVDFRSTTLAQLSDQANSYARTACILRVGGSGIEASYFDAPIARIGELEKDLHQMKPADGVQLAHFEALHDESRASFRKLDRIAMEYRELLSAAELERAEKVCGTFSPR